MKTRFITLFCSLLVVFTTAHAEENENGFGEVVLTPNLEFEAEYNAEEAVTHMNWQAWNDDVMWYKIVRSQTNPVPTFPEDESVLYTSGVENAATDSTPLSGKSFYRLCVITYEKDRYCSNVVSINTEGEEEEEMGMCAQVITPAENIETGACENFPTPCDVPEGWNILDSVAECPQAEKSVVISAVKENDIVTLSWTTNALEEFTSLVLLRGPKDSGLHSPFDSGVEVFPLDEEAGEYYDVTVLPKESYKYRICVPDGSECTLFSNTVVIGAEAFELDIVPEIEEEEEESEEEEMLEEEIPEEETDDMPIFSDIDTTSEMGQAVLGYALQGVINGFDDGTFRSEKGVTRAEIAKIAAAAEGKNTPAPTTPVFCDVPTSEWFAPFVAFFVDNGYAKGFESDACELGRVFSPHNPVLRSEAMKMIFEITQQDTSAYEDYPIGFSDVPEYHWVAPYAKAANALGIIDGELLSPDAPATRGEVVLILSRIQGLR